MVIPVVEISGLEAIILIVKDLPAQRRFYHEILGLEIEMDCEDAVFFKLGRQKLALFSKRHHPEATKRLNGAEKGLSHLEFRARKAHLKALRERLRTAGAEVASGIFEDADGNLFHFTD